MTHGSRTYVNCALTPYAVDGEPSSKQAVVFPPQQPTRRRSPDLSAYDRLDPPKPRRYGKGRVEMHVEGMDRLRASLDELGAKMKAAAAEAMRVSAEDAMRRAGYHSGGTVKADSVAPADLDRGEFIIGVDWSAAPDLTAQGYRWPDGSIRPHAHKRSDTSW